MLSVKRTMAPMTSSFSQAWMKLFDVTAPGDTPNRSMRSISMVVSSSMAADGAGAAESFYEKKRKEWKKKEREIYDREKMGDLEEGEIVDGLCKQTRLIATQNSIAINICNKYNVTKGKE